MTDPNAFRLLVRLATLSADMAAVQAYPTSADRTKAIVERALEALLANGAITIVPDADRPEWYVPDPPYTVAPRESSTKG